MSSVPISGPTHVPTRAQETGTVSSTSSSTTSSADEEFHPQPSSRSKVTTLGKPTGALACGGRFTIQISDPMWAPAAAVSLGRSCFIASDSNHSFLPEHPKDYLYIYVCVCVCVCIYITFRSLPFSEMSKWEGRKNQTYLLETIW